MATTSSSSWTHYQDAKGKPYISDGTRTKWLWDMLATPEGHRYFFNNATSSAVWFATHPHLEPLANSKIRPEQWPHIRAVEAKTNPSARDSNRPSDPVEPPLTPTRDAHSAKRPVADAKADPRRSSSRNAMPAPRNDVDDRGRPDGRAFDGYAWSGSRSGKGKSSSKAARKAAEVNGGGKRSARVHRAPWNADQEVAPQNDDRKRLRSSWNARSDYFDRPLDHSAGNGVHNAPLGHTDRWNPDSRARRLDSAAGDDNHPLSRAQGRGHTWGLDGIREKHDTVSGRKKVYDRAELYRHVKKSSPRRILDAHVDMDLSDYVPQQGLRVTSGDEGETTTPVVGTSEKLEKRYLRLTSAAKPEEVRPLEILRQSFRMLKKKWNAGDCDYPYMLDQLKSIRQDLTVQAIKEPFTVRVYEAQARLALEARDVGEFNASLTQLASLYDHGPASLQSEQVEEFTGYRVLYALYNGSKRDLIAVVQTVPPEMRKTPQVTFAVNVCLAAPAGNYIRFMQLYHEAPKMQRYLMDWFVDRERSKALQRIVKAYKAKPFIPVEHVFNSLKKRSAVHDEEQGSEFRQFLLQLGATFDGDAIACKDSTIREADIVRPRAMA